MTLWIGNGAVLKSSSQWQLNEFWQLNNSVHELSIFSGQKNEYCNHNNHEASEVYQLAILKHQNPYSSSIFKKILSLILQIFLDLEAFECNTTV